MTGNRRIASAARAAATKKSSRKTTKPQHEANSSLRLWLTFVLSLTPQLIMCAVFAYASATKDGGMIGQLLKCIPYAFAPSVAWSGGTALLKFLGK